MKKNVIALMCLLSLGLAACGNKAVENEEIPTENTEVVAEATEIEEVEETESTETAEEVVNGGAEAVSEEADAVADTTEKKTENKKTDASASTNAGTSTGSNTSSNVGNGSAASTPNAGNSNVAVTPSAPVAPAPAPTPTPAPDASANAGGSGDTIADTNNSQFTMEEIEQLEPGSQIGDTGFTWGGTFGGGEFQPTTDGYGDGTTITIEPVN